MPRWRHERGDPSIWRRHVRWLYPSCIEGGRASRGDAGDLVEVEGDGARAPRVKGEARVRFRARVRASVWARVRAGARVRVLVRVRVA